MVKIAVFAPIPNASTMMATAVKAGFFANMRKPYRTSFNVASMKLTPWASRHSSLTCSTTPSSRKAA
jgi:hypothetical protein